MVSTIGRALLLLPIFCQGLELQRLNVTEHVVANASRGPQLSDVLTTAQNVARRAGIGSLAGAATGAAMAGLFNMTAGQGAINGLVSGAVSGTTAGTVYNVALKSDTIYKKVPKQLGWVGAAALGGGVGVGLGRALPPHNWNHGGAVGAISGSAAGLLGALAGGGNAIWSNKRSEQSLGLDAAWTEERLDAFLDNDFSEYSAQCSHNTYTIGAQYGDDTTDPISMPVALDLGYRCIELDVWKRDAAVVLSNKDPRYDGMKGFSHCTVLHALGKATIVKSLTNDVDLTHFLDAINEWLEKDDDKKLTDKLPLIISIENHCYETEDDENNMKAAFQGAFGDRIVLPALRNNLNGEGEFKGYKGGAFVSVRGPKAKNAEFIKGQTKLKSLVAQSGEPRRIILKCSAKYKAMKRISAMPKDPRSPTYSSISIPMSQTGGKLKKLVKFPVPVNKIKDKHVTKIKAGLANNQLVRTYPANGNTLSSNYPPGVPIKTGAQMACINIQGKCRTTQAKCPDPIRGQKKGGNCGCDRDYAAKLEEQYMKYGFDGYIHLPSVDPSFYDGLMSKNDATAPEEAVSDENAPPELAEAQYVADPEGGEFTPSDIPAEYMLNELRV